MLVSSIKPECLLINQCQNVLKILHLHFYWGCFEIVRIGSKINSWVFSANIAIFFTDTLVTRDQPYLFATIFKHFIYVCFQLTGYVWKNLKTTNKKLNISTKIQPFWNVLKTFPNSCFVTRVFSLFLKWTFTLHPNICVTSLDTSKKPEKMLISSFYVEKSMCGKTTINGVSQLLI